MGGYEAVFGRRKKDRDLLFFIDGGDYVIYHDLLPNQKMDPFLKVISCIYPGGKGTRIPARPKNWAEKKRLEKEDDVYITMPENG